MVPYASLVNIVCFGGHREMQLKCAIHEFGHFSVPDVNKTMQALDSS